MGDPKSIREMLDFQELSEAEKQARGILGRLYGPCASIVDATRNGRRYNDELWEKVFSKDNEIVREMFENGGIPMELDHPVDREETCSEKIAAMMPEPPKRDKDGHLICYIDIIDTPCGKIAYALAKYGFKLGISSRGTGDLYQDENGDEVVDPDTYQFTTFDLVLLPAVKDARLSVCESLDLKKINPNKALKKALQEEYNNSSKEDQRIMDNTMKDLNIDINLEEAEASDKCKVLADGTEYCEIEDPIAESQKFLTEKDDEVEDDFNEEEFEEVDVEKESKKNNKDEKDEKASDDKKGKKKKDDKDDDKEDKKDEKEDEDEDEEVEFKTVNDLIKNLKEFEKDAEVQFGPIVIEDREYPVNGLVFDDGEDGKTITINIDYSQETGDNIEDVATDALIDENPVEDIPEDIAGNDGIDAVVENFKDVVRQKDVLESEVKQLKSEKAVGDAEVKKLKEELDRYRLAFARTSELATNAKKYESEVKSLIEQLTAKDSQIKNLQKVQASTTKLTESRDANVAKVKVLTEQLETVKAQKVNAEAELTKQLTEAKKLAKTRLDIAKNYKAKCEAVFEGYINSKASMLGVRPAEIKARLTENVSIEEIDKVCDSLLTESVSINRLPYGLTASSRVKVNPGKQVKSTTDPDNGYEVDASLLAFLD